MSTRRIDCEPKNSVEFISRSGKIVRFAFRIRHNNLVLRDAPEKEPFPDWVVSNSFGNKFRILQPKSHRRIRRFSVFVSELLPDYLKFFVIPNRIKPKVARGNEPELASLQTAEQLQRELALTDLALERSFVIHQHAIVGPFLSQSLDPLKRRPSCCRVIGGVDWLPRATE